MTTRRHWTRLNPRLLPSPWGRIVIWTLVAAAVATGAPAWWNSRGPDNGFALDATLVDPTEIVPGGPGRDGIPAIDRPRFAAAQDSRMAPDARVLGIELRGQARAYPVAVLERHEIVNDRIGGRPVVISYCPLCGTGLAFHAEVGGRSVQFGVSGLLYRSNLLLYDRATESLWTQMGGRAISGTLRGQRLTPLPVQHTTWGDWRARHPRSAVLRAPTLTAVRLRGASRYADYARSPDLWQPVGLPDRRLPLKEPVIGLAVNGQAKAWPLRALTAAPMPLHDRVGGQAVNVHYDAATDSAEVRDADGRPLPATRGYWFAWAAFHPDTLIGSSDTAQAP
ncbi:MAG: DUF3179 domain-containing protein [Immundisolibacter sp.]